MQITNNTITVLKNFSTINLSIVIKEGNVLETISPSKSIWAKAKVDTTFPKRFAMYNLNKLISTLSLFENPSITFNDKDLVVSDGNKSMHLTYSDESTIIKVPEKNVKLPEIDVSVAITNSNIKDIERALGVLSVPHIVIAGDGSKIYIRAADVKNPTGDLYSIELGETDKTFTAVFKSENIKVLPGDYTVDICLKGISRFYNDDVEYFIAVEKSSDL